MENKYQEFSSCCEAAIDDYSSIQYPDNVVPYSRCRKCGEMSKVIFYKDGEFFEKRYFTVTWTKMYSTEVLAIDDDDAINKVDIHDVMFEADQNQELEAYTSKPEAVPYG